MYTSNLRKRIDSKGNSSYQLIVEVKKDSSRKRYYKTVHGTKQEAQDKLHKFINEIEHREGNKPL